MEYDIVTGYSLHTLKGAVFHRLREGWVPQGGPFVLDTPRAVEVSMNDYSLLSGTRITRELCQAMIRAQPTNNETRG